MRAAWTRSVDTAASASFGGLSCVIGRMKDTKGCAGYRVGPALAAIGFDLRALRHNSYLCSRGVPASHLPPVYTTACVGEKRKSCDGSHGDGGNTLAQLSHTSRVRYMGRCHVVIVAGLATIRNRVGAVPMLPQIRSCAHTEGSEIGRRVVDQVRAGLLACRSAHETGEAFDATDDGT